MKEMFFYASLLLAAVTLNSCSQDSDLAADEAATAAGTESADHGTGGVLRP